MKKNCALFIALFAATGILQAQKTFPPSGELDWKILDVPTNVSTFYDNGFSRSYSAGAVYVSESEAVVPVRFKKGAYGLVKVNKEGKVVWQTPLDGCIKGMAKFKNKIMVLMADVSKTNENDIENLYVATADPLTGKTAGKKKIFENPRELRVEPLFHKTTAGEFNKLLIRTTADKINNRLWDADHVLKNGRLQVIGLGEDLSVKQTQEINLPAKDAAFIGSVVNDAGELFVAAAIEDQVVTYKFNASGVLESRLQAPFNAKNGFSKYPVLVADKTNSQGVLLGLNFINNNKGRSNQVYRFDFATKKVTGTGEEELNREYAKSIELQKLEGSHRSGFKKEPEDLRIIEIVQKDDKYVVVKEMREQIINSNGSEVFNNEAIIISFYDQNWKPIKNIGVDKRYSSFGRYSVSLGIYAMGDYLYLTSGTLTGPASYGDYLCVTNTRSMTLEKLVLLDKAGIGNAKSIEGGATVWFPDTFLLNYDVLGSMFSNDTNTILQKAEYK
jgi:hypothetical protein